MAKTPFARFVSSTGVGHVSRYGTGGGGLPAIIGGTREPLPDQSHLHPMARAGAGKVTLDTNAITALTADEWAKYRIEYERAVAEGHLRFRTEDEYLSARGPDVVPAATTEEIAQ